MGNYKDTAMKALAKHGNGVAAYIDSLEEAQIPSKPLEADFSAILYAFWRFHDIILFWLRFYLQTNIQFDVVGLQKSFQNPSQSNLKSMCKKR